MSKTVSKFALAAGISLALVGIPLGCASAPPPRELVVEKGSLADSRDGKTYKTVEIDGKTWMAENLNYEAKGSKCYDNKPENCAKYGRLYDWNSAMQSCPDGWLMPRNEEWQNLTVLAGSGQVAAKRLKATEGWGDFQGQSGNGTDNYAFSALPGGYGGSDGSFGLAGSYGGWWSANTREFKVFDATRNVDVAKTIESRNNAYSYTISSLVFPSQLTHKNNLYSTRCVQDKRIRETDSRDGKTYKTVKIGGQTWMAENLNYEAEGSKCFGEGAHQILIYEFDISRLLQTNVELERITLSDNEVQANCAKYGRLYNWNTAKEVCPSGWHLPTKEEWEVLVNFVGGQEVAGEKLKAMNGWNLNGYGTDNYYFSALPGGTSDSTTVYANAGDLGSWWSASEYEASGDSAYYYGMAHLADFSRKLNMDKYMRNSVRCVKN